MEAMTPLPACVRCDACRSYGPASIMERRTIEGMAVVLCVDAKLCRRRCEVAGTWMVYP